MNSVFVSFDRVRFPRTRIRVIFDLSFQCTWVFFNALSFFNAPAVLNQTDAEWPPLRPNQDPHFSVGLSSTEL